MSAKSIYSALFIMLSHLAVGQHAAVIIDDVEDIVATGKKIDFFFDSTATLSLKDIEQRYYLGKFSKRNSAFTPFTLTRGTFWFHLNIRNLLDEPLYMYLPDIFIEDITMYFQDPSGRWQRVETGFFHPVQTRALSISAYTLELPQYTRPTTGIVFWAVSTKPATPFIPVAFVGSVAAISKQHRYSEFFSITILGIATLMLIYSFCFWYTTRDRLFMQFSALILSAIWFLLWRTGLSFEWFWPNSPSFNSYPWGLPPFVLLYIWFANALLRVEERLPGLYRVSYVAYILIGLLMANVIMTHDISITILSLCICATTTLYLITSSVLLLRKVASTKLFIIAWIPGLAVALVNLLLQVGVTVNPAWSGLHAVEFAVAWNLLFLSFSVAHHYNTIQRDKYALENANIQMITEQKMLLKKMVNEQTEEIMAQNDQLLRHQDEIKAQNERLEMQNKAYERLKELILKQNHELESAVNRRTLQLAQSHEELKKHLHQVEQFSFISAHNLRAPVARILGLASIFDRSKEVGKENLSILDRIVASAKDLDIIIHDLGAILDTQKNTSEKTELIDVRQLLDKVLFRFEAEVGKEGIHIAINAEAKQILAVPAYMDSILSNLISNSIKYRTEEKHPYIQITTEELPSGWKIQIEDNGLGFDSKQVSRKLFEPFQRFHTHKDGKGLGMFLVKTQVVAMQGTIELHSEPNKGTRVDITIPKRRLQKTA